VQTLHRRPPCCPSRRRLQISFHWRCCNSCVQCANPLLARNFGRSYKVHHSPGRDERKGVGRERCLVRKRVARQVYRSNDLKVCLEDVGETLEDIGRRIGTVLLSVWGVWVV
jgi:hypothetical protein